MQVPLSCLKEYIDLPFSPEVIAETLTLAGLEVDEIKTISPEFSGVVVAEILEVSPHPNADRLKLTKIFDGVDTFQVVCGDAKCQVGMRVALAKIGASLPSKEGPFVIKKSKIRDIESFGMLCAADELGLEEASTGIVELDLSLPLGSLLSDFYSDTVFNLSLTPNLGRCMGILGVARELSAFFQIPLKSRDNKPQGPSNLIQVAIEDEENCPQYRCNLIQSVQVRPSPSWLAYKLKLCGLRTVNNVVDISNYVMLMTGHPLHFFDYDRVLNGKLFISSCDKETLVQTLDGVERTLPPGSLVIRDAEKVLAIAGIIGTKAAEISELTQNVLLEAAVFSPSSIRKTMKALSLKTDASVRFEKGVDRNILESALNMSLQLLVEIAKGKPALGFTKQIAKQITPKTLSCRISKINQILGTKLSLREVADLLKRLEIHVVKEEAESLKLSIPSYRNDLSSEIDLIEEIVRLVGFENLPRRPSMHVSSPLAHTPLFCLENTIRELLLQEGLQEFLTCDLISPAAYDLIEEKNDSYTRKISVLQSKSNDYSILRPSLLAGLLQLVKYNCDHQNSTISGFEVGRIHFKQQESFHEQSSAAIILSGLNSPHNIDPKPKAVDFYDCKGIVENLFAGLRIHNISFEVSHLHNFQPGRQARICAGEVPVGVIGEIHPNTLAVLDLSQRIYFAELDLPAIETLLTKKISTTDLPQMPATDRDWTVTLSKPTPIAQVLLAIQALSSPILEKVFLLDLFENEKLGTEQKNATFRFIYRAQDKTLDFNTVEQEHTKLTQKVAEKLANCIL